MSISRRTFIKTALAGSAAAMLPMASSQAANKNSIPSSSIGHVVSPERATNKKINIMMPKMAPHYDIADSHLHFLDFIEKTDGFPALIEAMDASGVSQAVVFGMGIAKQWDDSSKNPPSSYLSNDSRCYYYSGTDFILAEELLSQPKEIRERFHPFCCGVNGNDRYAADHIRKLLKLYPNFWAGIGELISRHDDLSALTYGEPPHCNSPAFKEIYDLGAEIGLPVLIHHDITAPDTADVIYLEELEEALAHNRNCKIIWAHVGISPRIELQNLTKIADKLLANNNNLWIDISWVVYDFYIQDKFPNNYFDGDTIDDWTKLIEKYPDRFMVGTDKAGHWDSYPGEIFKYYDLLSRLQPVTAAKLCKKNILSLIKKW